MKKVLIILFLLLFFTIGVFMTNFSANSSANAAFTLTSESIKNNQTLPMEQVLNSFGCTGANISPDLKWQNPPEGTKSFALLVHDPDAPRPKGWWHWLVVNIPLSKTEFKKGEKISAPMLETVTDFNTAGYGGACPPKGHGIHHYNFTLYALDVETLDVTVDLDPNEVEKIVKSHALANATITALYQR